jgi:hypothetical protein
MVSFDGSELDDVREDRVEDEEEGENPWASEIDLRACLMGLLGSGEDVVSDYLPEIAHVRTFREAEVLTTDTGFVLYGPRGEAFYITIQGV